MATRDLETSCLLGQDHNFGTLCDMWICKLSIFEAASYEWPDAWGLLRPSGPRARDRARAGEPSRHKPRAEGYRGTAVPLSASKGCDVLAGSVMGGHGLESHVPRVSYARGRGGLCRRLTASRSLPMTGNGEFRAAAPGPPLIVSPEPPVVGCFVASDKPSGWPRRAWQPRAKGLERMFNNLGTRLAAVVCGPQEDARGSHAPSPSLPWAFENRR